ncbi:MAG TPA: hypothetical protein VLS93_14230 [Anaeromyxobacteraceae bacterium]|nr:hypothetical protein [Anaeromyxobacteraceae bacterium]
MSPHATPHPRPSRAEGAGILGAYAILFVAWGATGGRFGAPLDNWQLLPWPALLDDLARSILDLHAQPPFLNLLLGIALKASRATGIAAESILLPVHFAVGAAAVLATWAVALRLVRPRLLRLAVLAGVALNPFLYGSLYLVFYTPWELMLLAVLALASMRYLESPGAGRLAAALGPALALVHVRSLFHPLWLALAAAALVLLARAGRDGLRHGAIAAAAVAIACAWPAKNLARFGVFGFSSWQGLNLARGLPIPPAPLLALFDRAPRDPVDPRLARAAAEAVPPSMRDRPVLAQIAKPGGAPNWNHYAVVPMCREMGAEALALLRREPALLAWKALDFYVDGYAVYEGRHSYTGGLVSELAGHEGWARAYEAVAFLPFRPFDPAVARVSTGFAVLFPAALAAILALLWVRRGRWGVEERAVAAMLLSVGWVLAMVVLVDGAEGNRVRYPTMPLLLLCAGWAASEAVTRMRSRA